MALLSCKNVVDQAVVQKFIYKDSLARRQREVEGHPKSKLADSIPNYGVLRWWIHPVDKSRIGVMDSWEDYEYSNTPLLQNSVKIFRRDSNRARTLVDLTRGSRLNVG